jgi:hypothetical protein
MEPEVSFRVLISLPLDNNLGHILTPILIKTTV